MLVRKREVTARMFSSKYRVRPKNEQLQQVQGTYYGNEKVKCLKTPNLIAFINLALC
jgi:hypothetical protein